MKFLNAWLVTEGVAVFGKISLHIQLEHKQWGVSTLSILFAKLQNNGANIYRLSVD